MASDILRRLPEQFNIEEVETYFPVCYEEPMNIVLVHELSRFNALTQQISSSLTDLQQTLQGQKYASMVFGLVAKHALHSYCSRHNNNE